MLVCQRCRAEVACSTTAMREGWAAVTVSEGVTVPACGSCKDLMRRLVVAFFDGANFNFNQAGTPAEMVN